MSFDQIVTRLNEMYTTLLKKNSQYKPKVAYELSKNNSGIVLKELDPADAKKRGWDDSAIFSA